jgi:hypothetical protein
MFEMYLFFTTLLFLSVQLIGFLIHFYSFMASEVYNTELMETQGDEEEDDQGGSQWFNNTIDEDIGLLRIN